MSNILEKIDLCRETDPFFSVKNFVAFPYKYYSNICLIFCLKNEKTMFIFTISTLIAGSLSTGGK